MSELINTPWYVEPGRSHPDGRPDGYLICLDTRPALGPALSWIEHRDVADLMASAPDLLTSLKELVEEIDFEIEQRQHSGNDEDWADLQEKSNRAHTAIAKAEGRI